MSGNRTGAEKVQAARHGLSVESYRARLRTRKWCTACGLWQLRSDFGPDSSRSDGLAASCSASRRVNGPAPGMSERRARRQVGEAWCRGCAAWLPANMVRNGVCRPHANAEYRASYARNPEPIKQAKRARRAGLAPIPVWWAQDLTEEFGGCCAYGCGRAATTWDHIWPVKRGGISVPGNLVPACVSCNSSKGARDPQPWVRRGLEAFPSQWLELVALAVQHNSDDWIEMATDG